MAKDVPLDLIGVFSTVLEGVLYGFSLLMFGITMWVLFNVGTNNGRINWSMVTVSVALLITSTLHMIIDIIRIEKGLVLERDTFPGGPVAFFASVNEFTFLFKNAVYGVHTVIGDGVVIYRCYKVWQSAYIIIVPVLGLIAVAISSAASVYSAHLVSPETVTNGVFLKSVASWVTAFLALTFAVNTLSTSLLAFRIWSIDRAASRMRVKQSTLFPILLIIADSGALYSFTLFTCLMCFVMKSHGQYVVLDLIPPIISISFYMIIIRVGLKSTNLVSSSSQPGARSQPTYNEQHNMKPLQVHVTHLATSDRDHSERNTQDSKWHDDEV